jgi:uncharacterized protein YmfQ (DUF2313 family)
MGAPNYQASDFLSVLQTLMPRGLAWPKDAAATMAKSISGLAPTWARHTLQNNNLLVDAFPTTTYQLLPEWEATLGLPDPCAGESPTIQQRRAQVVARFVSTGGQSLPYFIQFASRLGYSVSIEEFAPARAGQTRCGSPANSEAWAFTWSIDLPLSTVTYARAGQSVAGEPLASWGNTVLQCELARISPAHTILQFKYLTPIFDNSVVDDFGNPVITSDGFAVVI